MENKINDGGLAYPGTGRWDMIHGMTLRDWFAGQAIGTIIQQGTGKSGCHYELVASLSYRYADAMLKQREIKPEPTP